MIEQKDLDLLADLAKLLKKYGPESFERLQNLLNDDEFIKKISSVLNYTKITNRNIVLNKKHNNKERKISYPRIEKKIHSLKDVEPNKHMFLIQFYNAIINKDILTTRREIIDFSFELNIQLSKNISSKNALSKILNHLIELPEEKIKEKLQILAERKYGSTLEEWANLILKTRVNNNKNE